MPASPPVANGAPLQFQDRGSRPTGALTFRAPEDLPTEDLPPAPAPADTSGEAPTRTTPTTRPPLDDQLDDSPSGSASTPDEVDEVDESARTSSRSAERSRPLSQKAQRLAARQAVKMAGSMAHQYLVRDEASAAVGLYLVDDEMAAEIADPLARIAARHAPADGAMANPDVADGIAAMMGVAHFVTKQIQLSSEAAALRAGYQRPPAAEGVA